MPQLKPYDAGNVALQPTERGIDAQVQRGRRTAAFYNQAANEISGGAQSIATAANDQAASVRDIGSGVRLATSMVEDHLGHQEVRTAAAAKAKLFDQLSDEWNSRVKNADPNDPSVAAKFREEVLQPSLDKFGEAFSTTPKGQQWSETHVASMRDHFFQKTAADMSSLAGAAVVLDVQRLGNSTANSASKSPDFHTVDYLLGSVKSSVGDIVDSSPNIKGADAFKARMGLTEKMSRQIVEAGAIGAIAQSSDPEKTAQQWADKYSEFLSASDAHTLSSNARQQIRAARVDENYARHNQDLAAKKLSDAAEGEILKSVYSDDPKEMAKVSTRSIVNDDRLSNPTKEKLIRLVDREMKPESDAKMSAATSRELFSRIYLPADDPNRIIDTGPIIQARIDGKLTRSDFNELRTEVVNARTPEGDKIGKDREQFLKRYAGTVDGAMDMGGHSALGSQRMYQFEMDARRQETDLRKAGQDPHSLYDPSSPNFLGKQVAKYHVSFQEAQQFEKQVQGERKTLQPTGTPPPARQSSAPAAKEPVVVSKEQYDALPSGSNFTDRTGKKFVKP